MDRSSFIFALKTRVAGEPQKETLIGITMNKIFDGINELARIGIHLEVHEDTAPVGEEFPQWAKQGDADDAPERLVESQEELDALGDGWALKRHVGPDNPETDDNGNLLFSSGGAPTERRVSDWEHASRDNQHPALSLHRDYAAPKGAMSDADALNKSQATRRAQAGEPTPPPLNSPENGNVERVEDTDIDTGEHHDEGEHHDGDPEPDTGVAEGPQQS